MSEDLTLPQGGTWRWQIVWTAAGVPVDLTGCTAALEVRRRYADDEPNTPALLRLTLGAGLTITDPTTGTIDVLVPSDVTRALPYDTYRWECKAYGAGAGDAQPLVSGTLTVSPEVEREVVTP